MAFWGRLRQSKHKFHLFLREYRRLYTVNHSTVVANQHTRSHTVNRVLDNLDSIVQGRQLEFRNVRFYAAPAQANQKKEDTDSSGPRLNEQITAPSIRLVTDEGHYVVSRYEALSRAKSLKLDLVEVDRNAKPPVCKIMDYHKEKYLQQIKEKQRAKSKSTIKKGVCKEIRFAGKIKQNDLKMKADMARRLMESGYRVKCTAIDPTADCDSQTLLSRFSALIEDVAIVESTQVKDTQAFVVVRHVKFGPAKKGSGKKVLNAAVSSQSKDEQLKENGSETEPEELSDEDDQIKKKSEWSVFDGDDDINAVFDINEENKQPKSPFLEQSAVATGPSSYSTDRSPNHVVGNRYAKVPTAVKPSRNPTDINEHGAMNRINTAPQFPNQAKQPQFSMNNNASPQMRPNWTHESFKQDSAGLNRPASPTKSYGVFSPQKVSEQDVPAETNRYKKNGPSDTARSPRNMDPRMNRRPGVGNNGSAGKWGVFSADNSNPIPNKNENQAEFQRR